MNIKNIKLISYIILVVSLFFWNFFSFKNIAFGADFLIEMIPVFFIFLYFIFYKNINFIFILCLFLLIPWFYFLSFHFIFIFFIFFELFFLIFFIYKIIHNHKKNRKESLFLVFISSFIFIHLLWNSIIYLLYYFYFWKFDHQLFFLIHLLFYNQPSLYNFSQTIIPIPYFSNIHVADVLQKKIFQTILYLKYAVFFLWFFSWISLYSLSYLSHYKKYFHFSNNFIHFYKNKYELILILILFLQNLLQIYSFNKFNLVFVGAFFLSLIMVLLTFFFLSTLFSLFLDFKLISKVYYSYLLIFSFLLVNFHFYDFLHKILLNFHFYPYHNRVNSAFYSALSITYLGKFLIAILILLFLFNYKKIKLLSFLHLLGLFTFSIAIFISHVFYATKIVDLSENMRLANYQLLTNFEPTKINQLSPITHIFITDNVQKLTYQLNQCKICFVNPHKKLNSYFIKNQILKGNSYNFVRSFLFNIRLVDIFHFQKNHHDYILYNLKNSNHVTFITVFLFSLIYFLIFIFWFYLYYFLKKFHTL